MPFDRLRGAARAPAALAVILAASIVGACSKSEPQTSARPNAALPAPDGRLSQRADGDVDAALKERLARQEAASKMFDKAEPAKVPRAAPAEPPRQAAAGEAKKPEPAKAPEPAKVAAAPTTAPAPVASTPPASTPPPRAPEPAKAEPPPRVEVAAAKPSSAPAAPSLSARLVSRVDPEFPREAVQAGAEQGSVKARMTLDNAGNVTKVEVVEANPRRIFDRAVTRALSQWKFSEGASGRTVETEVEFRR